jgi:hypothetical protein
MGDESQSVRFIQPAKIYHGWRDQSAGPMMSGTGSAGKGFTFVTVNRFGPLTLRQPNLLRGAMTGRDRAC